MTNHKHEESLLSVIFPFRAFLSHSSGDGELVTALDERLRGIGIDLYLAEHDVRPGTPISKKVRDAIERSHAVVVLLTTAAADSAFVQQEIGYALSCDRPVIPLVEARVPRNKLAMLEGREYLELDTKNPERAFRDAERYLTKKKARKELGDALVGFAVVSCLLYLLASGEAGAPSLPSA